MSQGEIFMTVIAALFLGFLCGAVLVLVWWKGKR
jgi:hypothetical protein